MKRWIVAGGVLCSLLFAGCEKGDSDKLRIDRTHKREMRSVLHSDGSRRREELKNGLVRSEFYMPRSMLIRDKSGFDDPFAGPTGNKQFQSPKAVLIDCGIEFEGDASATLIPDTDFIAVEQTVDQMELVEAYFDSMMITFVEQIFVEVEIYEVPMEIAKEVMESLRGETDHTPERNALVAVSGKGKAKLIASKGIVGQGSQVLKTTQAISDGSGKGAKGRRIGGDKYAISKLEVSPFLAADDWTFDVQFDVSWGKIEDVSGANRGESFSVTSMAILHNQDWGLVSHSSVNGGESMHLVFFSVSRSRLGNSTTYFVSEPIDSGAEANGRDLD